MVKVLNVGLLGLGTVGSGVPLLIKENQKKIEDITGTRINIKTAFVRNIESKQTIADKFNLNLTTSFTDILEDEEIQVIVEVMGGTTLAKEYIISALKNKKHVVTANKDLIAIHGLELVEIAKENNCFLYYEASVAGGIPILRTISNSMSADEITSISGIVNGTTNFILTQMSQKGLSYDEALQEATRLGYAESDPTNDVEGIDAAYKMVILTRFSFGMDIDPLKIERKGITTVSADDIKTADSLGYSIKLLGFSEKIKEGIHVEVSPVLVPKTHPLSTVENEMNAIFINSFGVGESMYYGPGAGAKPTATSVVSDLITIAKNVSLGISGLSFNTFNNKTTLAKEENVISKHYFSLRVTDEPGVFKRLAEIMLAENVSLEQIKQETEKIATARIMIITHEASLDKIKRIETKLGNETGFEVLSRFKVLN
ncbi:homoserine dehydrogenase [Vagococcus fluvialis]|uniref:homoserine dehydrogenase n=1 Tax=Vagococcus fluvialis TaxID=2738 RepID=UPI001D09A3D5|nr:homoserine dehydrogenase [Vagococcus fluvialis]UDM72192.1 homoserine dehydrogenase [Vagococcus fluvialis]UDM77056.1 homoserine dehydrogenase [Vagococcus fluvialis]UDM81326.1 homoserine dehydrogenase [Vagococcus fluvialis]WNF89322.1 homoserine dehydrogenase [Vagococcus fluvialis]